MKNKKTAVLRFFACKEKTYSFSFAFFITGRVTVNTVPLRNRHHGKTLLLLMYYAKALDISSLFLEKVKFRKNSASRCLMM